MRNRHNLLLGLILIITPLFIQSCGTEKVKSPHAKYVFYFIGDGMGIQQVNATQAFLASRDSSYGNQHLSFTTFPATGFATTFAANRYITGSAAAGTARRWSPRSPSARGW